MTLEQSNRGIYIAFEGITGSGKSTQIAILAERLKKLHIPFAQTKEPGGDDVADAIRKVVQGTHFDIPVEPLVEVYLYAASRAQTLRQIVKPAIQNGNIVLADRSFFSSLAFQGFGRELGLNAVLEANRLAVANTIPGIVIHIDIPAEIALERTQDAHGDRFESEPIGFHQRCADGYHTLSAMEEFKHIWHTVNGTGNIDEVATRVWDVITSKLQLTRT